MKKLLYLAAAVTVAVLLSAVPASAQTLKSAYFLDNNQFAYRSNPSLMSDRSHLGVVLSNIWVSSESTLGMSDVLFPTASGLVTGFNPAISSEQFLGRLKPRSAFSVDVSENILSVNTRRYRSNGNFEVNMRVLADGNLPYDMFAFLKNGSSESAYNLAGLGFNAKVLAEVAYGTSFLIGDYVAVGFRLKGLFGLQNLTLTADKANLTVNRNMAEVDADATIRASGKYLKYQVNDGVLDLDSFDTNMAFWGPTGFGGALDLGVTVTPIENLSVSLAVMDMGAIYWKYNLVAKTAQTVTYTGTQDINPLSEDGTNGIRDEIDAQLEKLKKLRDFNVQNPENGLEKLPFSANLGARYAFFDGILSVGALASFKHGVYVNTFDTRLGVTTTPIRWFSLSANAGVGTYGPVWGSALSFNIGPFHFHGGVDAMIGKYAKVYKGIAPIGKFGIASNFGLVISFGEWHN